MLSVTKSLLFTLSKTFLHVSFLIREKMWENSCPYHGHGENNIVPHAFCTFKPQVL